MPKISIILPIYDAEKYLNEAIDSVLFQNFHDFEVILVNDGSNDHSMDIILSKKDPRVRIIENNQNEGLARSLNKGINQSTGEYIARMDADDVCHSTRMKVQAEFMDDHPYVDMAGSWFRVDGKTSVGMPPVDNDKIKAGLLFKNQFIHSGVMFRRSSIEKYKWSYNESFTSAQDYELWCRIAPVAIFVNIPIPLITIRIHQDQISRSKGKEQANFAAKARSLLLENVFNIKDPDTLCIHEELAVNHFTSREIKHIAELIRHLNHLIRINELKHFCKPSSFEEVFSLYLKRALNKSNLIDKNLISLVKGSKMYPHLGYLSILKLYTRYLISI